MEYCFALPSQKTLAIIYILVYTKFHDAKRGASGAL